MYACINAVLSGRTRLFRRGMTPSFRPAWGRGRHRRARRQCKRASSCVRRRIRWRMHVGRRRRLEIYKLDRRDI